MADKIYLDELIADMPEPEGEEDSQPIEVESFSPTNQRPGTAKRYLGMNSILGVDISSSPRPTERPQAAPMTPIQYDPMTGMPIDPNNPHTVTPLERSTGQRELLEQIGGSVMNFEEDVSGLSLLRMAGAANPNTLRGIVDDISSGEMSLGGMVGDATAEAGSVAMLAQHTATLGGSRQAAGLAAQGMPGMTYEDGLEWYDSLTDGARDELGAASLIPELAGSAYGAPGRIAKAAADYTKFGQSTGITGRLKRMTEQGAVGGVENAAMAATTGGLTMDTSDVSQLAQILEGMAFGSGGQLIAGEVLPMAARNIGRRQDVLLGEGSQTANTAGLLDSGVNASPEATTPDMMRDLGLSLSDRRSVLTPDNALVSTEAQTHFVNKLTDTIASATGVRTSASDAAGNFEAFAQSQERFAQAITAVDDAVDAVRINHQTKLGSILAKPSSAYQRRQDRNMELAPVRDLMDQMDRMDSTYGGSEISVEYASTQLDEAFADIAGLPDGADMTSLRTASPEVNKVRDAVLNTFRTTTASGPSARSHIIPVEPGMTRGESYKDNVTVAELSVLRRQLASELSDGLGRTADGLTTSKLDPKQLEGKRQAIGAIDELIGEALDERLPTARLRTAYREAMDDQRAFEDGVGLFNRTVAQDTALDGKLLEEYLKDMSPKQREAFQAGYAKSLYDKIADEGFAATMIGHFNAQRSTSASRPFFVPERREDELRMMLGNDRAGRLLDLFTKDESYARSLEDLRTTLEAKGLDPTSARAIVRDADETIVTGAAFGQEGSLWANATRGALQRMFAQLRAPSTMKMVDLIGGSPRQAQSIIEEILGAAEAPRAVNARGAPIAAVAGDEESMLDRDPIDLLFLALGGIPGIAHKTTSGLSSAANALLK